jgi:two-component system, response regulator
MSEAPCILLVEDNDDDAELTLRAFKAARILSPVVRLEDGVVALEYLFNEVSQAAATLPALMLLDWNLPRRSGLEVLKAVRSSPLTRTLPIVILTSSAEEQDRKRAYEQHANSYVQKPVDYEQFVATARQLGLYWTKLNVCPPRTER